MKLIGVDVGGTFTDIVYTDTVTGHSIILDGLISPETARRDFGVVLTPEMTVDKGATAAVRARRVAPICWHGCGPSVQRYWHPSR